MNDYQRFRYTRNCVYNINYHIIWVTKYRYPVLTNKIDGRLKEILINIATKNKFQISHIEIGLSDHIHLLVSAPPSISISTIIQKLKGASAYILLNEYPHLQKVYWNKNNRHLWSPSYFVETTGTINTQAISKYIDDQKRKEVKKW